LSITICLFFQSPNGRSNDGNGPVYSVTAISEYEVGDGSDNPRYLGTRIVSQEGFPPGGDEGLNIPFHGDGGGGPGLGGRPSGGGFGLGGGGPHGSSGSGPDDGSGGTGPNDRFRGSGPNHGFGGSGSNAGFGGRGPNDGSGGIDPNDASGGRGPSDGFGGSASNPRFGGSDPNDRFGGGGSSGPNDKFSGNRGPGSLSNPSMNPKDAQSQRLAETQRQLEEECLKTHLDQMQRALEMESRRSQELANQLSQVGKSQISNRGFLSFCIEKVLMLLKHYLTL